MNVEVLVNEYYMEAGQAYSLHKVKDPIEEFLRMNREITIHQVAQSQTYVPQTPMYRATVIVTTTIFYA